LAEQVPAALVLPFLDAILDRFLDRWEKTVERIARIAFRMPKRISAIHDLR
jgi:hypothetical protein